MLPFTAATLIGLTRPCVPQVFCKTVQTLSTLQSRIPISPTSLCHAHIEGIKRRLCSSRETRVSQSAELFAARHPQSGPTAHSNARGLRPRPMEDGFVLLSSLTSIFLPRLLDQATAAMWCASHKAEDSVRIILVLFITDWQLPQVARTASRGRL